MSLTVIVIAGTEVWLAVTGWKPDAMPPAIFVQGAAKVDWVTVWFFGKKTNLQDNIRKNTRRFSRRNVRDSVTGRRVDGRRGEG